MAGVDLDVIVLAGLAGGAVERFQLRRLAEAGFPGLRRSHGYVFQCLIDDTPTVGALAESLGITQQGASKQVRELEELGYVTRVPSPADARIRTVELTARGRAAVEAARTLRTEWQDELIASLGPGKVAAARDVLTAILAATGDGARVRSRTVPL